VLGDGGQDVNRQIVGVRVITATKDTPESINVAMNAKLRDSR
jgi:hypothetical protein